MDEYRSSKLESLIISEEDRAKKKTGKPASSKAAQISHAEAGREG